MKLAPVISAFLLLLGSSIALAQPAPQAQRTRVPGDVVEAVKGSLKVKVASGQVVTYALPDSTRITAIGPVPTSAIGPNSFIAVTAVPQADGTLLASNVNIFPEAMRGTGEGHYPMTGANTMTNATVASVGQAPRDTMTNATVAAVQAGQERRVSLKYKGGEKVAVIPASLQINQIDIVDLKALTPGTHIIVTAERGKDGNMVAVGVRAGKNGAVPPL